MSAITHYKEFIIRKATAQDIDFLISVICHAEKSGTDKFPLAWLLGKTEAELYPVLEYFLKEDIEGSEFALSGFLVAEYRGDAVAAVNAWIEKRNSLHLSSALIKAHLFKNILTPAEFQIFQQKATLLTDFMIEREEQVLQFENGYTLPEFQSKGIMSALYAAQISYHHQLYPELRKVHGHIFANNEKSIATCQKAGFTIVKQTFSDHSEIAAHFPYCSKVLLEKIL
ncbi:MAG: GNAT family N-acetyltransferase [Bacteroidetes bacterium]|nr:GNAT family N-acetyltransferase [Bacteroidota bacterium]MCL2302032.1 GNAT family N-acetyltransferase [Lentimicrobiaceae bacterium]